MTARSVHVSWGWLCGALAMVALATLTPQPGSSVGADFFNPFLPERIGQWRDVAQNVVLFLPLGLVLGIRGWSGARVVLASGTFSLVIELLQFVVPGRDPIARDVVTNTLGGAIGWAVMRTPLGALAEHLLDLLERWLVALRHPSRQLSARLSLGWALVVAVTTSISCWLMSPDLPPPLFFGVASSSIDPPIPPVRIGSHGREGGFTGLIDEVRIYTRARSADEVASDMNRAVAHGESDPSLAAAYGFDADAANLVLDTSGHDRRSFAVGTAWQTEGRFGGALRFDGRGSQVIVSEAAFDFSRGLTLEAWVFPSQRLRDDAVVMADAGDRFFVRASSFESSLPLSGVKFGGAPRMIGPRRNLPLRRWTHLAFTYDGRALRMYVNGRPAGDAAHWSTHQPGQLTLNGSGLPFGPMREPQRLPSVLLGDFSLGLTVTCGALEPQPAPVFMIAGIQSINALELLTAGSELRVRFPRKAQRLGLAPADQRIPAALAGCAAGQHHDFLLRGPLQRSRLYDDEGSELPGFRPGLGSAWSFVLDSQLLPLWVVETVSAVYLAVLVLPFGFWARATTMSIAGAAALAASFLVLPGLWGLQLPGVLEVFAIVTGLLLGHLAARRLPRAALSQP